MKELFYLPLLMLVYLIYARIRFGMTRSISATYGKLQKIEKILPIIILIIAIVVPVIILGINANTASPWRILWWFAGLLILAVGVYPHPTNNIEERIHVIGAVGGIIFGMLAIATTLPGWWNIAIPAVFGVFVGLQEVKKLNLKLKNNTYWTEVIAIIITMGSLIKHYLL